MVRGDARDPGLLDRLVHKADAIVPLACLTSTRALCTKDPVRARSIIVNAVREVLKRRSKSQIVIYPTTNSGYGIGEKGKFCTEETPLRPISLYGKLKSEIEAEILAAGHAITFRLATVFGVSPRMRTDLLVNDFVQRAVRDRFVVLFEADFKRNYLHVRDAAAAFSHCLRNFDRMKDQAYNVGLSEADLLQERKLSQGNPQAVAGVLRHRVVDRPGPGQAGLHRFQRQDRGRRIQGY